MGPDNIIAIAAIIIPLLFILIGAMISIWVKTKSEIDVIKSEVAVLRSMVEKQISIDATTMESLQELKLGMMRIETYLAGENPFTKK